MAKLMLIRDDGSEKFLKEVPDNVYTGEIVVLSEYLAWKLWSREDILWRLHELGYEGTEDEIDAVVNTGELKYLDDCNDNDWYLIDDAIQQALGRTA